MAPTPRARWFDGWASAFPGTEIPDHSAVGGIMLPVITAFYRFPHQDGSIQTPYTEILAFQTAYSLSEDDLDFYVGLFDEMRWALAEGREKGREYSSSRRPKHRRR